MDKEIKQIGIVLRDSVHLNNEQIERYLEDRLDLESRKSVDDHLRACCYCSAELELMREALQQSESRSVLKDLQFTAGRIVRVLTAREPNYTKFWLGEDIYPLQRMKSPADVLEILGLWETNLLRARRDDREDPGCRPVAIEADGMPPIVASLSDFEPVGSFQELENRYSPGPTKEELSEIRAFAPITLPGNGVSGLPEKTLQFHRKHKRGRKLKPEPILLYRSKSLRLEILKDSELGSLFLRISD